MVSRKGVLVVVMLMLCIAGWTGSAAATNVDVNINIGAALPQLVFPAPPALRVVPGTYVYFAPDASSEVVFYQDNWYRPHQGKWYVSLSYNGPWKVSATIPVAVTSMPKDYRSSSGERMGHDHVKQNWRQWERDRHWDHEAKNEHGHDRDDHGKKHKKEKKKKKHDHDDDDDGRREGRNREHDDDHGRGGRR